MARRKQHNGDLIVMETTRLWLEESDITDDLIVMETTRLWLEESNIMVI